MKVELRGESIELGKDRFGISLDLSWKISGEF